MCGALASSRPRTPGTPPYSILGSDNGHNTTAGDEIKIWKIAAEEEAEVGRSIGQEFQTQQTMQRNKSNKHGLADHINNQNKRRTLISRPTTTPAKGASTRASFCHYQSPISSSLTSSCAILADVLSMAPKPHNESTLAHQDEDNPYRTQACSSWASTLSSIEPKVLSR
ncbi:hypothetical protein ZWY2020_047133 [Hordeum vulgare]|nr:hypothetical protein ZWY2020_047133 [Hordeum vulgare]